MFKKNIKKVVLLTLLLTATLLNAYGQGGSGTVYGKVVDNKNEPVIGATVKLLQGGFMKAGVKTDIDGNYAIKPVAAGEYQLSINAIGLISDTFEISMSYDGQVKQDITLTDVIKTEIVVDTAKGNGAGGDLKGTEIKTDAVVRGTKRSPSDQINKDIIMKVPSTNVLDMAALSGSVLQTKSGGGISIDGSRGEQVVYIVDGVQVRSGRGINLPKTSISNIQVFSSGLDAKYGDNLGGAIAITTKGVSQKLQGGLMAEHSVEGYNNNLVNFTLTGPLVSKKSKDNPKIKIPVAGFLLAGDIIYAKDANPNFYKNIIVNTEKRQWLQDNPLIINVNGANSFQSSADLLRSSDFTYVKARENASNFGTQLVTKLDFIPNASSNITLGTTLNYNKYYNWSRANSLITPESNALYNNATGRTYLRYVKRVPDVQSEDGKTGMFSNIYFSLQGSYQLDYLGAQNPDHKKNYFNYGYIGKFHENLVPFYQSFGTDSISGKTGYKLLGYGSRGLSFEASDVNPILAAYDNYIFNNSGLDMINLNNLFAMNGLRNGDNPGALYQLYTNVGTKFNTFYKSQADQINFNGEIGFTMKPGKGKTNHSIEVGLSYEQRNDRVYNLAANSLWRIMRLLTNSHLETFDLMNPLFLVNGKQFTLADLQATGIPFTTVDTIFYNRLYDAGKQSSFDKSLREKLGLAANSTDYIQVDELDPSLFSLDMFSADDLFNGGEAVVAYYGYDYTGNPLRGKVSFNSFFTDKDSKGNYTRNIGAFQPVYIAGYITDKFRYRDVLLNFGLRMDRYDANSKVLADPYSLYATKTAKDMTIANRPSNIGDDYVVYTSDNSVPTPDVIGYRNGEVWYDAFGRVVTDPKVLAQSTASSKLQPILQQYNDNIKKATDDMLNRTFKDYKPAINLSPRLSFSFPINEKVLLYAHYDQLIQRPVGSGGGISNINYLSPYDYYYWNENVTTSTFGNPNLKPQKLIEYELGFQQVLDPISGTTLKISGFYKDRRDQIALRQFLYAYPYTYNTYTNRDFSVAKGLKVSLAGNIKQQINFMVNYTLQYAEGTGSSTTSMTSLINSGYIDPRIYTFMNFDVRHQLKTNILYYLSKLAPGSKVLKGTTINLTGNARSGTPFTRRSIPSPLSGGGDFNGSPIIGTINGNRYPWYLNFDARLDKDIVIKKGKKDLYTINVYMYVQNVFNTPNTLGFYSFTTSTSDDGYLNSEFGTRALSNLNAAQRSSYIDVYKAAMYNSNTFFNTPRRITLGFQYSF